MPLRFFLFPIFFISFFFISSFHLNVFSYLQVPCDQLSCEFLLVDFLFTIKTAISKFTFWNSKVMPKEKHIEGIRMTKKWYRFLVFFDLMLRSVFNVRVGERGTFDLVKAVLHYDHLNIRLEFWYLLFWIQSQINKILFTLSVLLLLLLCLHLSCCALFTSILVLYTFDAAWSFYILNIHIHFCGSHASLHMDTLVYRSTLAYNKLELQSVIWMFAIAALNIQQTIFL